MRSQTISLAGAFMAITLLPARAPAAVNNVRANGFINVRTRIDLCTPCVAFCANEDDGRIGLLPIDGLPSVTVQCPDCSAAGDNGTSASVAGHATGSVNDVLSSDRRTVTFQASGNVSASSTFALGGGWGDTGMDCDVEFDIADKPETITIDPALDASGLETQIFVALDDTDHNIHFGTLHTRVVGRGPGHRYASAKHHSSAGTLCY